MSNTFVKDPSARKDYTVDWSAFLDGDTISAVAWTVPLGLTNYATSATTTTATIWLSGGIANLDYEVVCQVTTAGGLIDQRTIKIQVREQ